MTSTVARRAAFGFALAAIVTVQAVQILRLLPGPAGTIGHDYAYFLPRLLAGSYWFERNGPFAVPWFSPAFGAGLPYYAHPTSAYVSLPQWLAFVVDPLTAVRATVVVFVALGFFGTWRLLRGTFALGRGAALFGAAVFAGNGFFESRMLIGHLAFHSILLLPWIAHCALAPLPEERTQRRWRIVRDALLGGCLWAYLFQSGNFYGIPSALIATGAIAALLALRRRTLDGFVPRLAASAGIALCLCAAKLAGSLAYLSSFPRSGYPLPGARSLWDAARLALAALFADPPHEEARRVFQDMRFPLGRHEWEYGVGSITAVVIASGFGFWIWNRVRARGLASRRDLAWIVLLALLLLIPLAVNVHGARWTPFLKSLPLVGSSSSNVRWLAAYLPIAAVAAALSLDVLPRARLACAAVCTLLLLAPKHFADRTYYARQPYSPVPIVEAWRDLQRRGVIPAITAVEFPPVEGREVKMTLDRDDALTRGASQLFTYEPLFGYGLEWFPTGKVRQGSPLEERQGRLNFHHPLAFLYPDVIGREAGEPFMSDERAALERFLAYGPLDVDWPWSQRIANALSAVTLSLVIVLLALSSWRSRLRPSLSKA